MALLKCPWILFSSVFYFRGWVYMLGFALLMVLFVIKMRGSKNILWKHIYPLSGSMIVLSILQYLNNYGNNKKIIEALVSRLWLEIFVMQLLVIVFCYFCWRKAESKNAEPKIHKTEQEWPPAIED